MDRLHCLHVFAEIARAGSFTAAARNLSLSRATVTKSIASLESMLEARLINRTTKQIRLTEAGVAALQTTHQLLENFDSLQADVKDSGSAPRGVIRIGAPPSFGARHLVPLITSFAKKHPQTQVHLAMDDGTADLVSQGLDLSVRIAPGLQDASYVAIPLVKAPQVVVASPDYLNSHKPLATPADLLDHNCLVHSIKSPTGVWHFNGPEGQVRARVHGTLLSNLGAPLQTAARNGHGISMHPYYMVADDLRDGLLHVVLPNYVPRELEVFVIYSNRAGLPMRVRVFLDHLKAWAEGPPNWSSAQRRPSAAAALTREFAYSVNS